MTATVAAMAQTPAADAFQGRDALEDEGGVLEVQATLGKRLVPAICPTRWSSSPR
jgi:hypothetical protein